jgi:hypothetical protein
MPVKKEPEKSTCDPAQQQYWESYGIPYCMECCDRLRTENNGDTLCIKSKEDCPLKVRRER